MQDPCPASCVKKEQCGILYNKTFERECKICTKEKRCIRDDEYRDCETPEEFRQDREDAYIMGLKWAINAAIMFNTHGMRFLGEMDEDACVEDPDCGIDPVTGEYEIEDHEEWSDAAQIIVDNFEKKEIPHWIFEVKITLV